MIAQAVHHQDSYSFRVKYRLQKGQNKIRKRKRGKGGEGKNHPRKAETPGRCAPEDKKIKASPNGNVHRFQQKANQSLSGIGKFILGLREMHK